MSLEQLLQENTNAMAALTSALLKTNESLDENTKTAFEVIARLDAIQKGKVEETPDTKEAPKKKAVKKKAAKKPVETETSIAEAESTGATPTEEKIAKDVIDGKAQIGGEPGHLAAAVEQVEATLPTLEALGAKGQEFLKHPLTMAKPAATRFAPLQELLKQYEVERLSQVPKSKWADLMDELNCLIANLEQSGEKADGGDMI